MNVASRQQTSHSHAVTIYIGWALLLLATILAYWPGLAGPFLLDDFGSIAALGYHGGVVDWESFKAFVFGGLAGPTGRPVSLLTFLLDANNWPADPAPFKRSNLIVHLVNGALLGALTQQLLIVLNYPRTSARWIALVSVACWLLHPFLVSTTLYVVQRMAQLATLFMLAGLLLYVRGRVLLGSDPRKAYWRLSLVVPVFTVLAMLSKENGVLLPILIAVVEITVFASQRDRFVPLNRIWAVSFIGIPTAAIVGLIGVKGITADFFEIVAPRDFSTYERLLTQPRILIDYLQNWYIPKLYTTGIFQDHFIKSTGILSPATTLLSLIFHVGVVGLAISKRRAWPLFGLAVLTFYASHLMESTILNLELYFEHRNYMAAVFLFLPIVVWARKKTGRRLFAACSLGVVLMLGSFTHYSAGVWQSQPGIVEASARKAPTSARAQTQYANMLYNEGQHDIALRVLDAAERNIPGTNALVLVNRILMLCNLDRLTVTDYQRVAHRVSVLPFDSRLVKAYNEFAKAVVERRCPAITIDTLKPLFTDMLDVPQNRRTDTLEYSHLQYLIGYVHVHSGEPDLALTAFKTALVARPGASFAMAMAALMATNEYEDEALMLSDQALAELHVDGGVPVLGTHVRKSDILEFQATVRADLNRRQGADIHDPALQPE